MLSECGPGHPPPLINAGPRLTCNQRKHMRKQMRDSERIEAFSANKRAASTCQVEPGRDASPVPSYAEAPAEENAEISPEPGSPAACGRKRTHWEKHYPWRFVTPRALNSRGEQIFYPVDNDQDRMWAWRLERALDHHRAVHERALDHHRAVHERDKDQMSNMYVKELKELSDGGLLRWRLERINELEARIVQMHKNFTNGVGYGL